MPSPGPSTLADLGPELGLDLRMAWFDVTDKRFGAKGDGVTDDSAAIAAAVNAAAATVGGTGTRSRATVFFPAGAYIVKSNAVFTPTNTTVMAGIHFRGSGWYTSVIRFGTLSSPTWLYDNGATARTFFNTFEDLAFEGADPTTINIFSDVPTNANGFKITSATNEQGFRFHRCRFGYFDVAFDMEGTNLASEMKFVDCKIHNCRSTVYKLNNVQSFNHEFFGCDVESNWGDIFSITGNGGGAIKVYGGSWILNSKGTTPTYFFKATASTGVGGEPFIFSGIRFEFHGDYSNLVSIDNALQLDVVFSDCQIQSNSDTINKPNFVTIGGYSTVKFQRCPFYEAGSGQMGFVINNTVALYGQVGTIIFDSCPLPIDWSDRCSFATTVGSISAINCHGTNVGAPAAGAHWAHDFDMWWNAATPGQVGTWASSGGTITSSGTPTGPAPRLKTAQLKLPNEYWPTNSEHTLKLPKNAIIKAVHIRKPAGGADSTVTTMRVGRNDKTGTDHLVSNSAAMNVTHSGDVNDYYYHVGSTTNERTLRLYSGVVTSGALQGGLCIVEYY